MKKENLSFSVRKLAEECSVLTKLFFVAGCLSLFGSPVLAMTIDTENQYLKVRWDNNVKYSAMTRLKGQDAELVGEVNHDDGNRNFDKGLVSNRLDLLTELDVVYKNTGFRVSGAAWYDDQYHGVTDNDSPFTYNAQSTGNDNFPSAAKDLHGSDAELLDAFVFGRFDFNGMPTTLRLGQHTLVFGETLFFGSNGIAAAQGPVDVVKLLSVPNTQFKELLRPVNQFSFQSQLNSGWSLTGYYQFEWEKTRLPDVGSYFSTMDFLGDSAEQLWLAPGFAATRNSDLDADDSGQGGVQLRYTPKSIDAEFGMYAVRYHDKTPQPYLSDLVMTPGGLAPTKFRWVFPEAIEAYGASFSTLLGDANVAGELSIRNNMPLVSTAQVDVFGTADNDKNVLYAVGRTAHINLSAIYALPSSSLYDNAIFTGEIGWNRLLSVTKNETALTPNATRDAIGLRFIFEPSYYQVVPGLDLSVPIGVGYNPKGSSSVVAAFNGGVDDGGDISIGLKGEYKRDLRFSVNYTHFFGDEATTLEPAASGYIHTFGQSLKDRDYLSLSVQYTF
ncbi:MAG: DUF1302 domain-containing protein [Neptuniibacter sp.]